MTYYLDMGKPLTPYQRGVIKRYYEHRQDLGIQNLSEIVSDLYLSPGKGSNRLWKRALVALKNAGLTEKEALRIVKKRDLQALARKVEELF